jgi:isoquinoline 1-oxidoreductase subunit beta
MDMDWNSRLKRRDFLKVSAATGGGMLLSLALPAISGVARALAAGPQGAASFAPNAFIRIGADDTVTVIVGKSEMGQGVLTSLPMIVAEELEADWSKVRFQQAPVDPAYNRPGSNAMVTGGSTSVRTSWEQLRKAGATAREMLLAAAAETWKVDKASCRAENGVVIHTSGKRLSYGRLADTAARMPVPREPRLKDPKDFKLIGKPLKRLDSPGKVNGTAQYGMDVKLPGLLTALVARSPVVGGKVASFDAEKARAVPGVKRVVQIADGVAVVADGFWAASRGRDALLIKWDEGPLAGLSTEAIRKAFADAAQHEGVVARRVGDPGSVKAAKTVEAVYELPYLAHACMEPMNCTAWVKPDGVELWTGTQSQTFARDLAAKIAGVKPEQVQVHTMMLGGGFGRRSAQDFVAEAVQISKAVKAPVKLVFTREDDTRGHYYRPATYTRLSGGLDPSGHPLFLKARLVAPSLAAFTGFTRLVEDGVDRGAVEGLRNWPYAVPHLHIDWVKNDPGVPIWFWRSVGASHNTFVTESFIDELAHAAGKDPFEFRHALLEQHPRHRAVLELAAERAGWGKPLPKGRARGIAVVEAFGSWTAQVAEVSLAQSKVRVHRVVCAADCGTVVNPDTVKAQMQSAIVFGLSAALYEAITFKDGRVEQGNFGDYPVLRMNEMPEIEVVLAESKEPPGGVGEPGTPPIAPAVCNAVFALTGKRIRSLPLSQHKLAT